jgi:hypothetical protein
MALTPETEAQILRYHHAERWPIGTIARRAGPRKSDTEISDSLAQLTVVKRP